MKLLTTTKIDLNSIFYESHEIQIKRRKRTNGKQPTVLDSFNTLDLVKYIPSCQYLIHSILKNQEIMNTDWYVNLSSKTLNKVLGNNNRDIAIQILDALAIIKINPHYLKGKFPKSYMINTSYVSDIHSIESQMTIRGDIQELIDENLDLLNNELICDIHKEVGGIDNLGKCDIHSTIGHKEAIRIEGSSKVAPYVYHTYQLKCLNQIRFNSLGATVLLNSNLSLFKKPNLIQIAINKLTHPNNLTLKRGYNSNRIFTPVNQLKRELDHSLRILRVINYIILTSQHQIYYTL